MSGNPFDFDEEPEPEPAAPTAPSSPEKFCRECGEKIRAKAEICPKCGVRQFRPRPQQPRTNPTSGIAAPLLVSAIFNIVVGLLWAWTCIGIILTIPMIVLCIFEFIVWSSCDQTDRRVLAGRVQTLAICEIVIGIFNIGSLICGVILLSNSKRL